MFCVRWIFSIFYVIDARSCFRHDMRPVQQPMCTYLIRDEYSGPKWSHNNISLICDKSSGAKYVNCNIIQGATMKKKSVTFSNAGHNSVIILLYRFQRGETSDGEVNIRRRV